MNRLCFGTFAKVLQNVLRTHRNNSDFINMLLHLTGSKRSISDKDASYLLNCKINLYEDIAECAASNGIINGMSGKMAAEIIPHLNPVLIEDIKEALRQIIKSDKSVASKKREELLTLADDENDRLAEFLSSVFLYVLARPNKAQEKGDTISWPKKPAGLFPIEIIRRNSGIFFKEYIQVNHIAIEPDILPCTETKSGRTARLNDVIRDGPAGSIILLRGEGGIGKSYILFDCFTELIKSKAYLPLYIPMRDLIRTDESPVLQYSFDKFFLHLNWDRDANAIKQSVRDILSDSNMQFVFFLDGLNEYTFAAQEDEKKKVFEEIRWLQNTKNVKIVLSSRSDKGYETAFLLQVKPLDEQHVLDYLQSQENTRKIDFSEVKSRRFLRLLQTPLMLALFTKTYSPAYTELGDISESVRKHSDILMLCVEYQKNRLQKTSKANYAFDILLPLITLGADMKMNMNTADLAKQASLALQETLSDDYEYLWFDRLQKYNRNEIATLTADKFTLYNDLIGETMLDNSIFLTEHERIISWQHELLMDWFAARGIVLALEYRREYALSRLAGISDHITKSDEKADGLLPVALFAVEMLEDKPIAGTPEFILLLSSLARAYHDAKDSKNIHKFAMSALEKMDAGCMTDYPRWKSADLMNHVAYTLLSVSAKDMGGGFDYAGCIGYAKRHFDEALSIIADETNDAGSGGVKLAEAQIYGNLGGVLPCRV